MRVSRAAAGRSCSDENPNTRMRVQRIEVNITSRGADNISVGRRFGRYR